mmetsp:Transcript_4892/g.10221  ORF Transcript_4892/g.10221 Transcript_4892/m.10221 type:complete len:635 (-) Transcript_4892:85-1989(-)
MISPSSTSRRRSRPTKRPHRPSTSTTKTLAILLLSLSLHNHHHQLTISAKEITATNEWQLLQENDTIPAGLHVRMDLSTGEKWAKLPSSDENEEGEESIKAAAVDSDGGGHVAEMDASGALTIVSNDEDNDDDDTNNNGKSSNDNDGKQTTKDYKMMHRVMSQLPPEELAPFGGLPALPSSSTTNGTTKLTAVELQEFETKMELLWQHRQDELQKMQSDGSIADLPKILRERIETLKGYLMDSSHELMELLEGRRRSIDHDEEEDGTSNSSSSANNIIEALRDLEFQLSDVDMARDFHTLGGWPYLIALLDDTLHGGHDDDDDVNDEIRALVDEIRALAATTIGTAVSNLGEFRHWALEDVSSTVNEMRTSSNNSDKNEKMTALSLLTRVFQEELDQRTEAMAGGTMAVEGPSHTVAMAKSRATFKLRAIYGLGSLLRGNPTAQQQFVLNNGPDVLVRNVLGTLSNVRGPTSADPSLSRLDYKFASKVLALGEDVVMDVVLHDQEYIQIDESATDDVKKEYAAEGVTTANQLVASFTTEQWCDLSLRMLAPPTEVLGEMSSRGIKERALSAVRAMAPSCQAVYQEEVDGDIVWGVDEVKRVRVEWNREGSGDGLDPVYRKELLDLVDGVLGVLQ